MDSHANFTGEYSAVHNKTVDVADVTANAINRA